MPVLAIVQTMGIVSMGLAIARRGGTGRLVSVRDVQMSVASMATVKRGCVSVTLNSLVTIALFSNVRTLALALGFV